MPRYARKTRKTYRKRRQFRKKFFRKRKTANGVHYFKRTMVSSFNTYDWPDVQHYVGNYTLAQLPNYAEFTSLFDEYKISRIKVKFIFSSNSQDVNTTAAVHALPNMITVVDHNDETALSSVSEYLEYPQAKIRRIDKPVSIYFRPKYDLAAYTGGTYGYANTTGWISAEWNDVKHYGIKYCIDPIFYSTGQDVTGRIQVFTTYYMKMRSVH